MAVPQSFGDSRTYFQMQTGVAIMRPESIVRLVSYEHQNADKSLAYDIKKDAYVSIPNPRRSVVISRDGWGGADARPISRAKRFKALNA